MDLPISNSDASPEWTRCLTACVGTLGIGGLLLLAFMVVVDPYDSGKFGLLGIDGVDDRDTHTAVASLARDANFDSAIIGNSTALMLDPVELSRATGRRFVQLAVTGASPREQFAVLDFFLRHHPRAGAWWLLPTLPGALTIKRRHGTDSPIGSTRKVHSATRPG
jgi:hypothetical protein